METSPRGYNGVMPAPLRDAKISAQAKLLYAELSSRINSNNLAVVPVKDLCEFQDVDAISVERWIKDLSDFILWELILEEKHFYYKISLLFPQRPVEEKLAPKEGKPIELTPEEKIRRYFNIDELQKQFPRLDLQFEVKQWSMKLIDKYPGPKLERDPTRLLDHFRKWLANSRHIKADVGDI
jgi:hypothetical protein